VIADVDNVKEIKKRGEAVRKPGKPERNKLLLAEDETRRSWRGCGRVLGVRREGPAAPEGGENLLKQSIDGEGSSQGLERNRPDKIEGE